MGLELGMEILCFPFQHIRATIMGGLLHCCKGRSILG